MSQLAFNLLFTMAASSSLSITMYSVFATFLPGRVLLALTAVAWLLLFDKMYSHLETV